MQTCVPAAGIFPQLSISGAPQTLLQVVVDITLLAINVRELSDCSIVSMTGAAAILDTITVKAATEWKKEELLII